MDIYAEGGLALLEAIIEACNEWIDGSDSPTLKGDVSLKEELDVAYN